MNNQTQLGRLIRLNKSTQLLFRCCFATSNNQIPKPTPEPPVRFAAPMRYTRHTPPKWNFRIKHLNWKVLGSIGLAGLVFHMWQSEPSLDEQFVPIDTELLDRATLISFPTRLKLDGEPEMTLLGIGVRTVSFLEIQKYSVGFYADLSKVNVKAFRRCKSPEECIDFLIQTTSCALRIVPTRSFLYTDMRDEFIDVIHLRRILRRKSGLLTTDREEVLHAPVQRFRALFPTGSGIFEKNELLHVVLSPPTKKPRELRLRRLGTIRDDWLATEFFLAYFDGTISPALVQDVKQSVKVMWRPNLRE